MPSLTDVLRNREAYPDDQSITLSDGSTVKLKELRDELMPKADMTRITQQWGDRERSLQQAVEGYQAQLAQALQEQQNKGAMPTGNLSYEDLQKDPVLRHLTERLDTALNRLQMHEQGYLRDRYTQQLQTLKFTDEADKRKFLDFAVGNKMTDLDQAHRLYTRDRDLENAVKEAEQRGIERGRKEARTVVPMGSRRAVAPDAPPPKTLDEALARAESDPEMWSTLRGESPG